MSGILAGATLEHFALTATVSGAEPLTVAELQAHLRVETDDDKTLIESLGKAAREYCERATGRTLLTKTLKWYADCWPVDGVIRLPAPPLQSVSTVKYYDTDDTLATLSSALYLVDTASEPGRITTVDEEIWPATAIRTNAVEVTYQAGYATAADVPAAIKAAIKLLVGNWYENREAVITGTIVNQLALAVESLLGSYWIGQYA